MADEDDILLLALFGDGEIGVARNIGLDLDEIHAPAFQHVHGAAAVIGSGDRDGGRELSFGAVEHRASDDHTRAEHRAGCGIAAGGEDQVQVAAHVAHAGDSVGNEQRQGHFFAARNPVSEEGVDVHVPQARDQILPGSVDYVRLLEGVKVALAYVGDSIAIDDDGEVRARWAAGGIHNGDIGDGVWNARPFEALRPLRKRAQQPHHDSEAEFFHRPPFRLA